MLCDQETAHRVATNLYTQYSKLNKLNPEQLRLILIDCYRDIGIEEIEFNAEDLQIYHAVLDVNGDNEVTFEDIQALALRCLTEEDEANQHPREAENRNPSNHPKTTEVQNKSHWKPTGEDEGGKKLQPIGARNPQSKSNEGPGDQEKMGAIGLKNSFEKPQQLNVDQAEKPANFNQRTLKRLEVAKRLFNKFSKNGFITEAEVRLLLNETYQQFGMAYTFNQNDAKSWMKMADQDNDGRVYFEDFQKVLLDGLVQAGINIY